MLNLRNKIDQIGDTAFMNNAEQIPFNLGCEELIKISSIDNYFRKSIFIIDGDAKIIKTKDKPLIREFVNKDFPQNIKNISFRSEQFNVKYLPNYFAPESFVFKILKSITDDPISHMDFWRSLEYNDKTVTYTSDLINNILSTLPSDFTNTNLKEIFEKEDSKLWNFIKDSKIITYYYQDALKINGLLGFIKTIKETFIKVNSIKISHLY